MKKYENMMEAFVEEELQVIKDSLGCCTCEQCLNDIAAYALNQLPPRYVVTSIGGAISKADTMRIQHLTDVRGGRHPAGRPSLCHRGGGSAVRFPRRFVRQASPRAGGPPPGSAAGIPAELIRSISPAKAAASCAAWALREARTRSSLATTAKPLPLTPAPAASA